MGFWFELKTATCRFSIPLPASFIQLPNCLLVYKPAPNVGVLICQYEHQIEKGGWSCIRDKKWRKGSEESSPLKDKYEGCFSGEERGVHGAELVGTSPQALPLHLREYFYSNEVNFLQIYWIYVHMWSHRGPLVFYPLHKSVRLIGFQWLSWIWQLTILASINIRHEGKQYIL
jgi:hypothetical protein